MAEERSSNGGGDETEFAEPSLNECPARVPPSSLTSGSQTRRKIEEHVAAHLQVAECTMFGQPGEKELNEPEIT